MDRPAHQFEPMSLDDFDELLADQPDDERWELVNGRVIRMMVGARWEHNRIISNLAYGLDRRFRGAGSTCRVLRETFRLKQSDETSSTLPDLMVYCSRPAIGATFLTDASILVEVLFDGTKRRDREDKWSVYQRLPSLRHDVLVDRDQPHVETSDRGGTNWSGHRIADGLDARLTLPDFGIDLSLAEIYEDVFPPHKG